MSYLKDIARVTVKCPRCGFTARRRFIYRVFPEPATCPHDGAAMRNPDYPDLDRVGIVGSGRRVR